MSSDRGGKTISVLVVDDSQDFLAAACAWISAQPNLVLLGTATNGADAVDASTRFRPDLVLIDAFMPVLDGFEATRRMKLSPDAPVVLLLSVHTGSAMEREARAAGADAFVPKSEFASGVTEAVRHLTIQARTPRRADSRPIAIFPEGEES